MAKVILLCGGGEPFYSSSQGFIAALKSLGHEVWSAGRRYFDRCLTDVELPPRQHPEYYSYSEVLDKCPWSPDLAICFDPGGFFKDEKPKGLKSILISTDAHRNGEMLRRVTKAGSYDLFANMQPNYSHFFTDLVKVHTSLPAFDERRFKIDIDTEPVCDISFCGQTGLKLTKEHWERPDGVDEVGKYISNLRDRLPSDNHKFEFSWLPSWDYSERGELLYRLSRDFDLRIYEPLWDEKLQLGLQKGRVGFNHSILNDVSIRLLEYMASGRVPIHDIVVPKWQFEHSHTYSNNLYRPFYQNYSLQYDTVKKIVNSTLVKQHLKNDQRIYREFVFANHAWRNRAQEIFAAIGI